MKNSRRGRSALLVLGLALFGSMIGAQEKQVVEEDLGDGFRAVSIDGGPPAIVDTRSGLILKMVYGRPAVVDKVSGAMLIEGDDGAPVVKYFKQKGWGGAGGETPKPNLKRMKAFLKRVKAHAQVMRRFKQSAQKSAGPQASKPKKSRIARLLELLGAKGEEAKVLRPLLEEILKQQDEIRASTLPISGPATKAGKRKRAPALPAAVADFHRTFQAVRAGKAVDDAALQKQLAAFRLARKRQEAALAKQRARLREILTLAQEAKLAAVGVLD